MSQPLREIVERSQPVQEAVTRLNLRRNELEIDAIFDPRQLASVFQPIVDLDTGTVVAAEALARWPHLPTNPDEAFQMARRAGRGYELDALCQQAAIQAAVGTVLSEGFKIFVNVEPGNSVESLVLASHKIELVVEITERALLDDPAELLRGIERIRRSGCGIALDDVGAVPESLALLPLIAPDVVKLDISLIQRRPSVDQARILAAVASYVERTEATVLAEGIETEAHLNQALALGATLGQGWYFGRPGPLQNYPSFSQTIPVRPRTEKMADTPFSLVDRNKVRVASKGTLLSLSRHLEQQGLRLETPPLVLAAFQSHERFTPATSKRYRLLAEICPLVVALGGGMQVSPARGVRGADLAESDELCAEWTVVIVGVHYLGALIARDLGDDGPDDERRFEFLLTHDLELVLAAARSLLSRVEPLTSSPVA